MRGAYLKELDVNSLDWSTRRSGHIPALSFECHSFSSCDVVQTTLSKPANSSLEGNHNWNSNVIIVGPMHFLTWTNFVTYGVTPLVNCVSSSVYWCRDFLKKRVDSKLQYKVLGLRIEVQFFDLTSWFGQEATCFGKKGADLCWYD